MSQNARDTAQVKHPNQGLIANNSESQRGGAAGDDEPSYFDRFGAFIFLSGGSGDKEETQLSSGFGYSNTSFTLGLDYLLNNSSVIGLAAGYGASESDLLGDSGGVDIETSNINLYAAKYFTEGWYFDGIAGLGSVETETVRSINYTADGVSIDQNSTGRFDSAQSIFSVGLGRGSEGFVDIDLSVRLNYINLDVDRVSETPDLSQAGYGLAIEIEAHEIKSLTSFVSASISKAFSQRWGVLVPKVSARWVHEYEKGDEQLYGRFLADTTSFDFTQSGVVLGDTRNGSTVFTVPLEEIDQNYGSVSIGATALLPNQFSADFSVSRTIGFSDFAHTYFAFTLRRDFR